MFLLGGFSWRELVETTNLDQVGGWVGWVGRMREGDVFLFLCVGEAGSGSLLYVFCVACSLGGVAYHSSTGEIAFSPLDAKSREVET